MAFEALDHSSAITKAFPAIWPNIKLLNCWPHFERKSKEELSLLKCGALYNDVVKIQLAMIHLCRTPAQAVSVSEVLIKYLESVDKVDYAKWLTEQYLNDHWFSWYITASGCPGVLPHTCGRYLGAHQVNFLDNDVEISHDQMNPTWSNEEVSYMVMLIMYCLLLYGNTVC